MLTNYKNDRSFGLIGEERMYEALLKRDATFIKSTERWAKWDFKNDAEEYWEGKTRTNAKDKYPTTYIPTHKVLDGKTQFFLFNFTDKMAYIRFDP